MFIFKALRLIFVTLDNAIYELVDLLYQLFMLLAETGIFSTEAIRTFSERIYFFLGLIMVFKVSISLLQYILNPDAVNDGKIGASKLLKNIVFVLVGIVLVPYIFDAAFSLQRIILKDNIIGNLILGTNLSGEGKNPESVVKETGNIMAFSTFTAFLHFNDDYITSECSAQPFDITEGDNRMATASNICIDPNTTKNSEDVVTMLEEFYNSSAGTLYMQAYEKNNMHKIAGHMKVYNYTFEDSEGDDVFLFDYTILVTSAGGIFLAYVLLIFCFDVAVRAVKLGFLQLVAPVPLIAKIDPKKGDEVFNKWVKECTSTYLNLFVRLVAIYFALYIITLVGGSGKPYNIVTKKDINNPFVYVFIIFGVLLFVKDLPKLIETLTGMKINTGGFGLKNKLGQVPLVGGKLAKGLANAEGKARGLGKKFMQNRAGNLAKTLSGNKSGSQWANKLANSKMLGSRINKGEFAGLLERAKKHDANSAERAKAWNEGVADFKDSRLGQFKIGKGNLAGVLDGLGAGGQELLDTSDAAYQQRVNAGRREGIEREKSSGLLGDSGYKGTTIGKTLSQTRYKEEETAFENSEKARIYNEKVKKGERIYQSIQSATASLSDMEPGFAKEDATNKAKAQVLFPNNAEMQNEYVLMSNAKYARDQSSSIAEELEKQYARGEIADYSVVDQAKVNAKKAASYYKSAEEGFTTRLNGCSETVVENYGAYTAADDRHKYTKVEGWATRPEVERITPSQGGIGTGAHGGGSMSIDQSSIDAMTQAISESISSGMKKAVDSSFGDNFAAKIGDAVGSSVSDKLKTEIKTSLIPDLENSLANNNRKQTEIIGETVEDIIEEEKSDDDSDDKGGSGKSDK